MLLVLFHNLTTATYTMLFLCCMYIRLVEHVFCSVSITYSLDLITKTFVIYMVIVYAVFFFFCLFCYYY